MASEQNLPANVPSGTPPSVAVRQSDGVRAWMPLITAFASLIALQIAAVFLVPLLIKYPEDPAQWADTDAKRRRVIGLIRFLSDTALLALVVGEFLQYMRRWATLRHLIGAVTCAISAVFWLCSWQYELELSGGDQFAFGSRLQAATILALCGMLVLFAVGIALKSRVAAAFALSTTCVMALSLLMTVAKMVYAEQIWQPRVALWSHGLLIVALAYSLGRNDQPRSL